MKRSASSLRFPSWLGASLFYAAAALVPLGVGFAGMQLASNSWRTPLQFAGDVLENAIRVQALIEGSWRHVERLDAPFAANLMLYPLNSHLDYLLALPGAFLTGEAGTGLLSGFLLKLALAGLAAAWCFRRLGFSRAAAFLSGTLYALLPYAFFRNVTHYNLSHYLIPFPVTAALLLLQGQFCTLPPRQRLVFAGSCVLLGLNGIYAAAFSCMTLACAALGLALQRRFRAGVVPVAGIALIGATSALAVLPYMAQLHHAHEASDYLANRKAAPSHSSLYGLALRELAVPGTTHPLAAIRSFSTKVRDAFDVTGEQNSEYPGFYALFGLLGLGLLALATLMKPQDLEGFPRQKAAHAAAGIALALGVIATIDGFGTFFALFVTPKIRCFARIATVLGFLGAFASGMAADALQETWRRRGGRLGGAAFYGLAALLLALGAYEQAALVDWESRWLLGKRFHNEAAPLIKRIEEAFPENAMIYQWPDEQVMRRERSNQAGFDLEVYPHLRGYLLSRHLRWSTTHLHARSDFSALWHRRIAYAPTGERMNQLALAGFDGLWVDSFGDAVGPDTLQAFDSDGGVPRWNSEKGRYALYDLRPLRTIQSKAMGEKAYAKARHALLHSVELDMRSGASKPNREIGGGWDGAWMTGDQAGVLLPLPPQGAHTLTLLARIPLKRPLLVKWDGEPIAHLQGGGDLWLDRFVVPFPKHLHKQSGILSFHLEAPPSGETQSSPDAQGHICLERILVASPPAPPETP